MKDSVRLLPLNIINKNLLKLSLVLPTSECFPFIFLSIYPPFFLETKSTPLVHIFFLIQMHFLNSYLVVSPHTARSNYSRRVTHPSSRHLQTLNTDNRKRASSSNDIFSTRQTQTQFDSTGKEEMARDRKLKSYSLCRNAKDLQVDNCNNLHIQRTIDSVNQYAEQLKVTLINQYKHHKMQTIRKRHMKQQEEAVSPQMDSKDKKNKHKFINIAKHPTYKTLNTMYQAIIDSSFQQTRKDGWELQAVKLPIVNRMENQFPTLDLEGELICKRDLHSKDFTEPRKQFTHFVSTFSASKQAPKFLIKKQKGRKNLSEENIQIIPWATFQEQQWE